MNKTEIYKSAINEFIVFKNKNVNNSGHYLESNLLHIKKQIEKNNHIYNDPNRVFGKFRLALVVISGLLGFYFPFHFGINLLFSLLSSLFFLFLFYEILHKIPVKNYLKNINYSKLMLDIIQTDGELALKNNLIFIQYALIFKEEVISFIGKPQTQVPNKNDLLYFQDFNEIHNFIPTTFLRLQEIDFFKKIYKVENIVWHSGANPQSVTIEIMEYS